MPSCASGSTILYLATTIEQPVKMLGSESSTASVQELQDDLADVDLNDVGENLHEEEIIVQLPGSRCARAWISYPCSSSTDLFHPQLSDQSSQYEPSGLRRPVIHEAAIWVDELGTVALAPTAAVVVLRSAAFTVRFDHPLLFFIRDNRTSAIVFSGRVADPSFN